MRELFEALRNQPLAWHLLKWGLFFGVILSMVLFDFFTDVFGYFG